MPNVEARRSPRIDYRVPVELLAPPHEQQPLLTQALDLGAGGMRVSAKVSVPVGSPVTCRFAIDGRPAALPGRVAWSRAQGAQEESHRLGICFDELPGYTGSLLEHAVARGHSGYRQVELCFEDLDTPVTARAQPREHGLRLSAALPFLRRGGGLSFRLDEEGPLFRGKVADAVLAESAEGRRLEVDIDVEEHDSVRFRRRARYGYLGEIDAKPLTVPRARPATGAAPVRSSGWGRASLLVLLGAALGAGSSFALLRTQAPAPPSPAPATRAHVASEPARAPSPDLARGPAAVIPPTAVAPSVTKVEHASATEPTALVEGLVTRVRIPFSGSLQAMVARIWAEPLALAIDLPNAQTSLAPRGYPVHQGGVVELRVSTRGSDLLLRLKLDRPPEHYSVTAQDGVLEVMLQRADAADPAPSSPSE